MKYGTFNDDCKRVFDSLFNGPNQPKKRFGTHTIRRSAYVNAVWGEGVESDIRHSARHFTQACSDGYRGDATTLLQFARENSNLTQLRPYKWKIILVDNLAAASALCVGQSRYFRPLVELADIFIRAVAPELYSTTTSGIILFV
jgi:hypothetical protein